ncbi:MAG: hypothetical protein ACT4QF_16355 [Sporichthyaceae bacterium]
MSLDDLERRVGALEERLDVTEGLRASQDRDLAALEPRTKAMMRSLQAISLTVSEHGTILREHGERLNRIESTLVRHGGMHEVTHEKLDLIVTMLDRL